MLVATFRTDDLHPRHPLRPYLAELERLQAIQRLKPERFARWEVEQQLAGLLGPVLDRDVVAWIYQRSEGNPFLVEELAYSHQDNLEHATRIADRTSQARSRRAAVHQLQPVRDVVPPSDIVHVIGQDARVITRASPRQRGPLACAYRHGAAPALGGGEAGWARQRASRSRPLLVRRISRVRPRTATPADHPNGYEEAPVGPGDVQTGAPCTRRPLQHIRNRPAALMHVPTDTQRNSPGLFNSAGRPTRLTPRGKSARSRSSKTRSKRVSVARRGSCERRPPRLYSGAESERERTRGHSRRCPSAGDVTANELSSL